MKRTKWLLVGLTALMLGTGCGAREHHVETNDENYGVESKKVTFTDDLGREVTVENPKRVAALLGSFADMWYLAGGEVVASADDAWEDFDLPLSKEAVNLGMTKKLNLEKLFEANPDFVLASTNTKQNVEWRDTLESAKINVAYFEIADFEDYLRVLRIFTKITGRDDLYEKNGTAIEKEMQKITKESQEHILKAGKTPKVLVIRASASMIRAKGSEGNVLGEMLLGLGCENIADANDSLLETLSVEHIMVEDPDYIFVAQVGDDMEAVKKYMQEFIAENPAWSNLSAAKENRIFYMEKEWYTLKPNDEWAKAYRKIEEILFEE